MTLLIILLSVNFVSGMSDKNTENFYTPIAIEVQKEQAPLVPALSPRTTAASDHDVSGIKKENGSWRTTRSERKPENQDETDQKYFMTKHNQKHVDNVNITALLMNIKTEIDGVSTKELKELMSTAMCFVGGSFEPVLYNIRRSLCCNGLFTRNSSTELCCNGKIIHSDKEICCTNKIFIKSETNNSECCGEELYNPDTHICCRQRLYPRRETSTCCGEELLDSVNQVCCYGLYVHNRTKGDKCCGSDVYDSNTQTCCFGIIQEAYGENNSRGRCCKEKSYDARCYRCKETDEISEIVPLFNERKQMCCRGVIQRRRYLEAECCGNDVYDASSSSYYRCFGDKIGIITARSRTYTSTVSARDFLRSTTVVNKGINVLRRSAVTNSIMSEKLIIVLLASGICTCMIVAAITRLVYIRSKSSKSSTQSSSSSSSSKALFNEMDQEKAPLNNAALTSVDFSSHASDKSEIQSRTCYSTTSKLSKYCSSLYLNMPIDECVDSYTMPVDRMNEDYYVKESNDKSFVNICDNLFVNSGTQTCQSKQTNLMNTFGRPFNHMFMVDSRNGSIKMPESEESMVLPSEVLKTNVIETHCSTYWNLKELCEKFVIPNDETLASPVAEYKLIGHEALSAYAVVIKPFIGRAKYLQVYKFPSDQGINQKCEPTKVPSKDSCDQSTDCFYEIKDNYVYIFTKSFSGFFCTTCKHTRNLILTAFLYGSYKKIQIGGVDQKYEIRLRLYIADELLKFSDYQQNMKAREQREGRLLQSSEELNINDKVVESDELQLALSSHQMSSDWAPKTHPTKHTPLFNDAQTVEITRIAAQCQDCPNMHRETRNPFYVEWYYENKLHRKPSPTFQCIIDILCMTRSEETQNMVDRNTLMIVDDLTLPGLPSYSIQSEGDPKFQQVRSFLEHMEQEKQERLQNDLCRIHGVGGDCLASTWFLLMRQCQETKILYEELKNALQRCKMSEEIKYMEQNGWLHLAQLPIQREQTINEAARDGCSVTMETTPLLPSHNQGYIHEANGSRHSVTSFPSASGNSFVAIGNTTRSVANRNNICNGEMSQNLVSTFSEMGPPAIESRVVAERNASYNLEMTQTPLNEKVGVQENASIDETMLLKI